MTNLERRFDRAARQHRLDYRDLGRFRGVVLPPVEYLPLRALVALLEGVLAPRTAIVLYARDEARQVVEAFVIDARGIAAHGVVASGSAELATRIQALPGALGVARAAHARMPRRRDIAAAEADDPEVRPDGSELVEIGERLLPPPLTEAIARAEHVIVVPTLDLGKVPFAAFPLAGQPLGLGRTVTVAPSLGDLGAIADLAAPGCFEEPLVVGDPEYADQEWTFPDLPGARNEATLVARRLGVRPLLGRAATLDAVRTRAPTADLLYFATHGVGPTRGPLDGFLALAGGGRYCAGDIQGGSFRARLAILSACQTGVGVGLAGGTVGLARAFQLRTDPRN